MPRRKIGVLGAQVLESSSDDEDYLPPGSASKYQRPQSPNSTNSVEGSRRQPSATTLRTDATPLAVQQPSHHPSDKIATSRWVDLPLEAMHTILLLGSDVSGGACPIAFVVSSVCTAWRRAVQTCPPSLWHTLDLSHGWCRPTDTILTSQSHYRWSSSLRNLNLSGCSAVTDDGLRSVADACHFLEDLNISQCRKFTASGLCEILGDMVLRVPGLHAAPLKRLDVSGAQPTPYGTGLNTVLRTVLQKQSENTSGPVLEELIVEGCARFSQVSLKQICAAAVRQQRPLLSALRVLKCSNSGFERPIFVVKLLQLQYATPNIEVFEFRNVCHVFGWRLELGQLPPGVLGGGGGGGPTTATAANKQLRAEDCSWPHLRVFDISLHHGAVEFESKPIGCSTRTAEIEQALASSSQLEEIYLSGVYVQNLNTVPRLQLEDFRDIVLSETLLSQRSLRKLSLGGSLGGFIDVAIHYFPWLAETLEELDVSHSRYFDDRCLDTLHICTQLRVLDASSTDITTEGVAKILKALLSARKRDGNGGDGVTVSIESCRGVERSVRQAASQGMPQLYNALGIATE